MILYCIWALWYIILSSLCICVRPLHPVETLYIYKQSKPTIFCVNSIIDIVFSAIICYRIYLMQCYRYSRKWKIEN